MKMTGEERIAAPIEAVWAALNDPDVLRACIPGCQSLEPDGENGFKAAATIKIGPISARFGGTVRLYDLEPPRAYRISGEGSGGAAGAAKGGAQVRLVEDGADTVLHYDVAADVSGRLAQLGGKLIDITAKQLAGMFFARFSQEVVKRQAAGAAFGTATAARPADLAERQPAARPLPAPAPAARAGISTGVGMLLLLAALTAGFILGRTAEGWDGSGALAGGAVGLLVVLVAAAAFLLGQGPGRSSTTVSLDADSIDRLARALQGKNR